MAAQDRLHIFPIQGNGRNWRTSHCTDATGMCWCKPELKQVCTESDDKGKCKPECWRCAGTGLLDPYDEEAHILIMHKKHQLQDSMTYFCSCGRSIIDYTMKKGAFCTACRKVTRKKF